MAEDRVAIVTGAARGIGAATARALAADGWRLVLADRCADDPALTYSLATAADLEAAVAECGGADGQAVGLEADVRDQAALDRAVASAIDRYGRLDAAVAAAGCVRGGQPSWETPDEVWDVMMDVNFGGVRRLVRAAAPALLDGDPNGRRIVAVSSMGGAVGLPLLSAYVAAKHAVNGLVRSLAAELGPQGVTVNSVAPGSTETAMLDASAAVYDLPDVVGLVEQHLLRRALRPDEVAAAIAWLCSPASSGITGAVVPVDAGATSR